jgi:hypothetical protein
MTHSIIKTENYLLVVDESKIESGSKSLLILDGFQDGEPMILSHWQGVADGYLGKKIIYHLPLNNALILEGVPLLPPLEAKEKYKWTDEDMINFAIWRNTITFDSLCTPLGELRLWESLQQSKYTVSFKCEMDIKCWCMKPQKGGCVECNQKPKTITNSQGLTQLVGKYIY